MILQINMTTKSSWLKQCGTVLIAAVFIALVISCQPQAKTGEQRTFSSPDEAVKALVGALKAEDTKMLSVIFGPGSEDIFSSGDPVADKAEHERFINRYEQKNRLEEETTEKVILSIGDDDWPLAIPIVKEAGVWRFDTQEGREELLARRIGRNELDVIQVCLAIVDAQREYAHKDRNADGLNHDSRTHTASAGLSLALPEDFTLNLSGYVGWDKYRNFEGLRGARETDIYGGSVALSRPITDSLSASLSYGYQKQNSNYPTLDYDRNIVTFVLGYSF